MRPSFQALSIADGCSPVVELVPALPAKRPPNSKAPAAHRSPPGAKEKEVRPADDSDQIGHGPAPGSPDNDLIVGALAATHSGRRSQFEAAPKHWDLIHER